MSFYSHITLRKVGAPLIPYEATDYSTPDQRKVTRLRYDEETITGYQNFRSLDELVCQFGKPADNPNFDPGKESSEWSNPKKLGRLLDHSDVCAIAQQMEPLYKVLLPLPDKALEAVSEGDWGVLEAILGTKAKAKALEKAIDAAAYGTPFYLCSDSFFTHKFMDAARTFIFLAGCELPIVGSEHAYNEEELKEKPDKHNLLVYYYGG